MIENQTLITDSDVNEMARSMGLEVNESPSTDGESSTLDPGDSISGTEALENILVENRPVLEAPIRYSRDRVEAAEIALNAHIEGLMRESPAITELTSEHITLLDENLTATNVRNVDSSFWEDDITEEEGTAVENTISDPNPAPTTIDAVLEATVNPNIIPPISESVNTAESTVRFSGASWFEAAKSVSATIAGVGGIGSWTSLLLSRISTSIRVNLYDDDKVEVVNLAGQLFSSNQVGLRKVYAAQEVIRYFSGSYCNAAPYRIASTTSIYDNIVICGFDNMEARKILYRLWKARAKSFPVAEQGEFLFIDGRMNAEEFQIFSITGDDDYNMKRYEEEFLFSDAEVAPAVCSYKQTTYCASMIASFMINSLVNFLSNQNLENMPRQVPFYINYDAQLMHLKLED